MGESCCGHKPVGQPRESAMAKLCLYKPLLVILAISLFTSAALNLAGHMSYLDGAMGMFLIQIALLKLLDVRGFADSFQRYDLVAGKLRVYALAYPFLELLFGVLFLSGLVPLITNIAFLVFMVIGTLGVVNVLRTGQSVQCACAGSGFALPVGRVTLLENVVMGAMAVMNLVHIF